MVFLVFIKIKFCANERISVVISLKLRKSVKDKSCVDLEVACFKNTFEGRTFPIVPETRTNLLILNETPHISIVGCLDYLLV